MKYLHIPLKDEIIEVIIDDEHYDYLSEKTWSVVNQERDGYRTLYFRFRDNGKYYYLHRFVMDAQKGELVDHINHDHLDNRKENLRICTKSENARNKRMSVSRKLKWRGYSLNGNKFTVSIDDGQSRWYSYGYKTEMEAAKAYDRMAVRLFGDFANLNFKKKDL